jgi:hypothetical protein
VAQRTGATLATIREAAQFGELLVVTILLINIPNLPKNLFEGVLTSAPVVDTSNYYPRYAMATCPSWKRLPHQKRVGAAAPEPTSAKGIQ